MKIERNCPHCKRRVWAHVADYNVPTAYGANTPAAVLAQCPEPTRSCGKQWRALLRKHEREEMEAEKIEAAIACMPRPEGWYWVLDSYGDWEPMYYNVKGWRTDFGSFCHTDEDVGEIGPMIGPPTPNPA